jgi:hypothetical protein
MYLNVFECIVFGCIVLQCINGIWLVIGMEWGIGIGNGMEGMGWGMNEWKE